jgi:hypothetical protein
VIFYFGGLFLVVVVFVVVIVVRIAEGRREAREDRRKKRSCNGCVSLFACLIEDDDSVRCIVRTQKIKITIIGVDS